MKCLGVSSLPCGLFISAATSIVLAALINSHPLDVRGRLHGILQPEPSYLPEYNGFIAVHSVNRTPPTTRRPTESTTSQDSSTDNLSEGTDRISTIFNTRTSSPDTLPTDLQSLVTEGTSMSIPEVEEGHGTSISSEDRTSISSEDRTSISSDDRTSISSEDPIATTQPKIHVVTKTLDEVELSMEEQSLEGNQIGNQESRLSGLNADPVPVKSSSTAKSNTNVGETLVSGSDGEAPVEAVGEDDVFDSLMSSIHNHWLEFVGKMKLSVLDVWKSISQHMMERLENFASVL